MQYQYTGDGHYLVGLPACDLDDQQLTDEQRDLLKAGLTLKLYQPVEAPEKDMADSGNHE